MHSQVSDDLIEAWIWWFNTHQPAQGGVWVPHLGWVHTLIARPTDPRPAPAGGGRERAAPPPRPYNLCTPSHEGLEAWESGTARSRGHNLTKLTAHYPETTRAAPPPRERDPGTIAMIVLENGHYYQVRIIPHPQDNHWSLEAVDCMLRATTGLPDNPTPLLPNQPPDPLTAIVSGAAGTWQPDHAPYCLWRWARRRWLHTRAWSAAWRFYLDGPQQMEAIRNRRRKPPLSPTYAPSSRSTRSGHWRWVGSCSPPSALRRRPGRHTRPWCTKSSVPSAAPLYDVRVTPPRALTRDQPQDLQRRQQLGPRTYGPERQPRRPPHPPTHPPPPSSHPPPNHTNNTPPTPRGLRAVQHHLGPAHHRAPDKSVRPNGRRNDDQHNTTRPQGAGDT